MKKNIVLGVCGSIAAYKSAEAISLLKKEGFEVKVIMTEKSLHFITPLTLQTLSQNLVSTEMFSVSGTWEVKHISLADWADLILILPATANFIGKVVAGLADDLLCALILASKSPVLFAPSMNKNMWKNEIVQENVKKLKKFGYEFVGPEVGRLASGKKGIGRLVILEKVVKKVKGILNK